MLRRSRLLRAVLALVALYALVSLLLALFANAMLFRPPRPSYRDDSRIFKLRTADGVRISARYLPNPRAKYTLLYSHGKREDLGSLEPFLLRLHDWGYAVLAYDYEGYGTSEGRPTEEHCYADLDAAYDYLTKVQHVPPWHLLLFGYSLGTGPTVDLAARQKVGGVILDSAYTSTGRVLTRMRVLPFDHFDNLGKISHVSSPILFVHRRDDGVVPHSQGKALSRVARARRVCFWVAHGGHEGIYDDARYGERLKEFCRFMEESPRGAGSRR